MAKIAIEITKYSEVVVTYINNKNEEYNIVKADTKNFNINNALDKNIIILISNVIHQLDMAFKDQLIKQGFVNKPLNKPTDGK